MYYTCGEATINLLKIKIFKIIRMFKGQEKSSFLRSMWMSRCN